MLSLSSCMIEQDLNQEFQDLSPIDIGDNTTLSSPQAENMDQAALNNIYADIHSDPELWSIRSLLVYRHNKLVTEQYYKDNEDIY